MESSARPTLLASLAQRLEMLCVIFNNNEPMGRDCWMRLKEHFSIINPSPPPGLTWKDWSRYSNRQRKKVPMGGLTGSVHIAHAAPELWEWLRCASLVHAGKGTVMGLGGWRLSSCSGYSEC
ncbi:CRISPR system precrRNA processing endoribonuclease RAMP protein Cas6 [Desulfonatronum thioautotrophicum]|uniref:CRISPR system precrRNA processing endoribonuclease RAMP protein Cas6 n=1 Tax=Desulfonatronum thioautotrophicum TaxID=617001 RepID=UPI000A06B67C